MATSMTTTHAGHATAAQSTARSFRLPQFSPHRLSAAIYSRVVFPIMEATGQVAQLVEHRTEKATADVAISRIF